VAQRLKTHNRPEDAGGKDFWERVCLVTSKDQNLTKAHVKYLESKLIGIAASAGRCVLSNGTAHEYVGLPESDRADMAFFLDQIRTVLPVLGFEFLRELSKPPAPVIAESVPIIERSPRFRLDIPKFGVTAYAQEIGGEFFVLKGSRTRKQWIGVDGGYQGLFQQLEADGVLIADGDEHLAFKDDYAFASPSAAAAVVSGRSANGRVVWSVDGTGQTYAPGRISS